MSTPNFPLQSHPRVLSRKIRELTVLLNLQTKQYFSFDAVGSRMWSVAIDAPSFEEGIRHLLDEYEVAEPQLRRDFEQFLALCLEQGLLHSPDS